MDLEEEAQGPFKEEILVEEELLDSFQDLSLHNVLKLLLYLYHNITMLVRSEQGIQFNPEALKEVKKVEKRLKCHLMRVIKMKREEEREKEEEEEEVKDYYKEPKIFRKTKCHLRQVASIQHYYTPYDFYRSSKPDYIERYLNSRQWRRIKMEADLQEEWRSVPLDEKEEWNELTKAYNSRLINQYRTKEQIQKELKKQTKESILAKMNDGLDVDQAAHALWSITARKTIIDKLEEQKKTISEENLTNLLNNTWEKMSSTDKEFWSNKVKRMKANVGAEKAKKRKRTRTYRKRSKKARQDEEEAGEVEEEREVEEDKEREKEKEKEDEKMEEDKERKRKREENDEGERQKRKRKKRNKEKEEKRRKRREIKKEKEKQAKEEEEEIEGNTNKTSREDEKKEERRKRREHKKNKQREKKIKQEEKQEAEVQENQELPAEQSMEDIEY